MKLLDFGFFNMDCMEGMKEFPDKYFDLAIVDPPYGDAKLSDNSRGGGLGEIRRPVRPVQESIIRSGTSDNRTDHGVSRTGGGWSKRYDQTKKS